MLVILCWRTPAARCTAKQLNWVKVTTITKLSISWSHIKLYNWSHLWLYRSSAPAKLHSSWPKFLSHAHTVVWECCKDVRQSQWGMAKFDPQPTLNPLTDRHQIWNMWLRRVYLLPTKLGLNPPRGFCPPYTRNIHPKPSNVYFFFFSQFFRKSTDALVGPIFALNTSYDVVLRKEVPFWGWEKLISKFYRFIRKIRKIYNGAYGEILKKI